MGGRLDRRHHHRRRRAPDDPRAGVAHRRPGHRAGRHRGERGGGPGHRQRLPGLAEEPRQCTQPTGEAGPGDQRPPGAQGHQQRRAGRPQDPDQHRGLPHGDPHPDPDQHHQTRDHHRAADRLTA
ncbi:hypothetical protein SDC9_180733 [bioreactor metagenome]|uniref:Uncharacterized protein n=1 Tax=bioreactor metagenome TaxID=1076179 RepID=A0A645H5B6_9ZZZZ